jgi:hypothetical protein
MPEISDEKLFILSDGLLGVEPEKQSFELFLLEGNEKALRALWDENKEPILQAWIRANPGTRPSLWWSHDAPRITRESLLLLGRGIGWAERRIDEYCEPRKRLGGVGTPHHECLNYVPSFHGGVPDSWIDAGDVATYADLDGVAIDPSDPPTFESQAAYLRRHGLFAPGEERRLRAKDFEPETITIEEEEHDFSTLPELTGSVQ